MTTVSTPAPSAHDAAAPAFPEKPRDHWNALVAEFDAVNAVKGDDITDDIIERAGDLIGEILAMPAPDPEALRFKLDYLLDPFSDGYTGSYSAEYTAQTVADYRRFLTPEPEVPATPDQRAAVRFEGVDAPFKRSNADWSRDNLPQVRIASVLLGHDDVELTEKVRTMLQDQGLVPALLDSMTGTKDHLEGVAGILGTMLTRFFIVLERLGYGPDNPPPEAEA